MLESTSAPEGCSTSVYRYFDAHDVLIYVGITSRGLARNVEHNRGRPWWQYVVRQEVDHFPTREAAHAHEVELIERHTPPFNIQHNRSHREMAAAYAALTSTAMDVDPADLLRASGGRIPIYVVSDRMVGDRRVVSFRTEARCAPLVALIPSGGGGDVKVRDHTGVGCGHVESVERRGPFAVFHACVRAGIDVTDAVAQVKRCAVKGPATYALRRIKLAS